MDKLNEIHNRHMADNLADVPTEVRSQMKNHLENVAIHNNCGETADAIAALYAAHGVWEEFLADEVRRLS